MDGQPIVAVLTASAMSDQAAERLAGLFDAHQRRLYRIARRLVDSADEARDLVQETFLRAARAPDSVPVGLDNEQAWLVRVLVNIRHDQWRRAAVRRSPSAIQHLSSSGQSPDPEAALIARRTVWQALDRLHPRRRAVVVMHEIEGMPAADIAALLGISRVTVRWHLSRGRRELARVFKTQTGELR
jgi:RNA polymerase sigma-70 factor (ECF subfamily)